VSSVPAEIAGLGSSSMKLRVSPGFDPLKAQVGPDEYFLLSRIDGNQTIREVLLATGLPVERGIAIVTRLRSIGALLLPGETAAPAPAAVPRARPPESSGPTPGIARTGASVTPAHPITPPSGVPAISALPTGQRSGPIRVPASIPPVAPAVAPIEAPAVGRTPTPSTPLPTGARSPAQEAPLVVSRTLTPATPLPAGKMPARPAPRSPEPSAAAAPPKLDERRGVDIASVIPDASDEERAALAEPGVLSTDERVRILNMARLVDRGDPWALLGVPSGADAKTLKRAYFKLSKLIHPDRFYGKQLGSFAERLSLVFEAVSRAYAKLTTPEQSRSTGAYQAVATEQPQTPQEYAAELFDRACGLEVGGDALGAMKLFAAAVRMDPQTRYLRRAATCALAAAQPKTAVEYAKKAQSQSPHDPSAARLLAQAFKAAGKLGDAEEVLVMAMAMKSENDVLAAELRNDLAEVRRLLQG
jgi:hypothetical protein